ncbi:polymer-forming cytoskeletal protein [Verrucomicrobiaceae bacterium E54]|nr:polymer-forming cytoskeletal protein [Verrucomicrobiaceae bacterium E54]
MLSADVDIKGTVKFTNDLVVDGKIEGEISSEGNLTVGENARLKAEIKTATVVVYGKVHGNIIASERVDLKSSAEVVGDIKAKTLSIESGAIFVGKSTVGTPSTPATSASKPQSQPEKKPDTVGKGNDSGGKPQNSGGNPQQQQQSKDRDSGNPSKPEQGNLAGLKS